MSRDLSEQNVLVAQDVSVPNRMPYTMRVLPVHAMNNRHCRCTTKTHHAPGDLVESTVDFNKSPLDDKQDYIFVSNVMSSPYYYWQTLIGTSYTTRVQMEVDISEADNQIDIKSCDLRDDRQLLQTEDPNEQDHGHTAKVESNIRIPTISGDQKLCSEPEDKSAQVPTSHKPSGLLNQMSLPASSSSQCLAGDSESSAISQEHCLSSSSVKKGRGHKEHFISPSVSSRHCSSNSSSTKVDAKWMIKPWSLDLVFLSLALLFIAPVSGGFDRGGFQHQITWGRGNSPPGSAVFGNAPTNVTAVVGHRARLPCQVKNLGLKDVSWIRQRDLHILTVGIFTYTSDDRFKVFHPHETEDWFLDISSVTFRDSGIYECQVSTSPKVSLPINLTVLGVQEADIPGPDEVFIQHGSTISLQCEVQAGVEAVGPVHWLKGPDTLNYSSPRGGISMEVEKTPTKTTSKLYITRAIRADSGNYTCAPQFAKPDSVLVHVVNAGEESAAAVHSGGSQSEQEESILIWAAALLPISWLFLNLSSTRP